MSNNQNLKAAVAQVIKNNGNQEITGDVMQQSLFAIINHFGSGSVFGGIAVPNTNPIDSDVNSFYFATANGTYSNFGGYVIDKNQFTVFSNKSGSWVALNDLNVKSISVINKTSTNGFIDTYTITFSDGSTFNFTVTNGKSLEVWEAKPYAVNTITVKDNTMYISNTDVLATDVPGVSNKWTPFLIGLTRENLEYIIALRDDNQHLIGGWDDKGNFFTNYSDGAIPASSVAGLEKVMQGIQSMDMNDFFTFISNDLKILGSIDSFGTLRVKRVIADSFETTAEVKENVSTSLTSIVLPEYHYLVVNYVGDMPTDSSPTRTPMYGTLEFNDMTGNMLFRLKTKVSIQGQSTAGFIKKGYSFDFMNENGDDVLIKFGSFPAVKGMHFKAYTNDLTHTRDVAAGILWQQAIKSRPFPYNQFKVLGNDNTGTPFNEFAFYADAKFSLQGIPLTLNNRGKFWGLYTMRQKKGLENFALDGTNQNHIFLDSTAENGLAVGLGNQNYGTFENMNIAYEVRSPKKKNITALTKSNCMRFFNYFKTVFDESVDFRATHSSYIYLPAWVDFVVIAEALMHWDSVVNNASYFSYNGTHWIPGLFDLDNTAGNTPRNFTTMVLDKDIFPKFKTVFLTEIKARYTELRKNGVLTNKNMVEIYGGIGKFIPMSVITDNYKTWGTENYQGIITNMDGIYNFWNARFAHLDSIWLNP